MTLPNLITVIRILLVPIIIYLLFNDFNLARIVFLICMFTDVLDGFIARVFKIKTKLGAVLDPFADKILILSSYIILTHLKKIPEWLFLIVLGRDILIISGWFIIYILTGLKDVKVRFLGKLSVGSQMLLILFVFFNISFLNIMFYITAGITLISLIDYFCKNFKKLEFTKT